MFHWSEGDCYNLMMNSFPVFSKNDLFYLEEMFKASEP